MLPALHVLTLEKFVLALAPAPGPSDGRPTPVLHAGSPLASLRRITVEPPLSTSMLAAPAPRDASRARGLDAECDRRDPRCHEFHSDFGRADTRESPFGIASTVATGAAGPLGVSRLDRSIDERLEWDVRPGFAGVCGRC